jgi:hypothetical protein
MKKLMLALVILLLMGGTFAAGWFLPHGPEAPPPDRPEAPPPGPAARPAVLKPRPKAPPDWTEWQYPDSKEQASGKGGGGTANGVTVGPIYSVELTTTDDLDKVLQWYAKKFNNDIIAMPTGGGGQSKFDSNNPDDPIINGDVLQAGNRPSEDRAKGMWRPVKMKVITLRTPRYDLVINISRAEGESHTHVIVTYLPNPVGQ